MRPQGWSDYFFLQFRYLISVRCFTIIAIGHLYNSGDFKKVNDCFTGLTTNWTGKVYIDTCKRFHKKKLSKKLNHVHFFFQMKVPSLLMTLGLVTVLFCGCVVVQASSQCLSTCVNSSCRQECRTSNHAYGMCRRKYNCPSTKPKVCQCVL